jgi:ABC-2 type transport system ATP-binding protein
VLRLRGVGKRYGRVSVLHDVNLDVAQGEVIGIVGANGSGKSTLMRILARVSRWRPGTVEGKPVTGFLPDRFPANQRMTALEYLSHLGRIRGLGSEIAIERAVTLLDRLDLSPDHDTPMRTLSKGNAQKVGLAQALLPQPELLILDEPWSGLDRDTQRTLSEIIGELRDHGASVVFTDHREAVIAAHASRTYRLRDGSLDNAQLTASPMVRVVLDGRGASATTPWSAVHGVHVDRDDGAEVELTVLAGLQDELLMMALRAGWSVREVTPR